MSWATQLNLVFLRTVATSLVLAIVHVSMPRLDHVIVECLLFSRQKVYTKSSPTCLSPTPPPTSPSPIPLEMSIPLHISILKLLSQCLSLVPLERSICKSPQHLHPQSRSTFISLFPSDVLPQCPSTSLAPVPFKNVYAQFPSTSLPLIPPSKSLSPIPLNVSTPLTSLSQSPRNVYP